MKKYVVLNLSDPRETMYIDPKTGEVENLKGKILWAITDDEHKKRLLQAKIKKLRHSPYKNNFFWFKYYSHKKIFNDFSTTEIFRIFFTATFLKYGRNSLKKKGGFISKKELKKRLNLSEKVFNEFYNKLTNKKILIEKDTEKLELDNDFFEIGRLHNYKFAKLFEKNICVIRISKNTIKQLYQNVSPRGHKNLGYVFRLIPFLNRKYNVCCKNPLEEDFERVIPLTVSFICENIFYYSKNQTSRIFKTLSNFKITITENNRIITESAIKKIIVKGGQAVVVNPRIFYAGGDMQDVFKVCIFSDPCGS